jgi:hypothetical protein
MPMQGAPLETACVVIFFLSRSASLREGLRQSGVDSVSAYPALCLDASRLRRRTGLFSIVPAEPGLGCFRVIAKC